MKGQRTICLEKLMSKCFVVSLLLVVPALSLPVLRDYPSSIFSCQKFVSTNSTLLNVTDLNSGHLEIVRSGDDKNREESGYYGGRHLSAVEFSGCLDNSTSIANEGFEDFPDVSKVETNGLQVILHFFQKECHAEDCNNIMKFVERHEDRQHWLDVKKLTFDGDNVMKTITVEGLFWNPSGLARIPAKVVSGACTVDVDVLGRVAVDTGSDGV